MHEARKYAPFRSVFVIGGRMDIYEDHQDKRGVPCLRRTELDPDACQKYVSGDRQS
jgi:hypothetical protein